MTATAETETALEGRVKLGALTLNEMRDSLGLDPYANAAADRPMVLTATGYVPIEAECVTTRELDPRIRAATFHGWRNVRRKRYRSSIGYVGQ